MKTLVHDARYGLRMMAKKPGANVVVVLSLALGIGANTTIFSVINALLLRPPKVEDPGRLVDVWSHVKSRGTSLGAYRPFNYPDYVYLRNHNAVFSGLAAAGGEGSDVVWSRDGQGQAVKGLLVTGNYFTVLGVKPERGRTFLPEEDEATGASPAVMVSHDFWRQQLGADPAALSKPLILNGHPFRVVGVVPPYFRGTMVITTTDVWIPIVEQKAMRTEMDMNSRNVSWLTVVGRLRPGKTIAEAGSEMQVLSNQLSQAFPDTNKDIDAAAFPVTFIPGPFRGFFSLVSTALMAVVSMVLLIACANAANLLLAQASGRWREMAVRAALGASRRRLVRQTLTESVLLASLGGMTGLALASSAAPLLLRLKPPNIPIFLEITPDWRVLGFTLAASVLTGLVFGMAPAMHAARLDLVSRLKDGTPGSGRGRSRLRSVLVTAQVAVCLVLLIGAGLCLRSLLNAQSIDPGFETHHQLVVSLDAATFGYDETRGRELYKNLLGRAAALPGVSAVSLAETLPLGTQSRKEGIEIDAYHANPSRPGENRLIVDDTYVAPDYFKSMGIPLLRGRDFNERDNAGAQPVAIINQAMAERYWPGKNPIGRHFSVSGPDERSRQACEVIGVVKSGKYYSLSEDPLPFFYRPYWQNYEGRIHMIVRTSGNPLSALGGLRAVVKQLDPNLAIFDAQSMSELMKLPLFPARAAGLLLGAMGALAMLLAVAGLYGVMSYLVSQRTQEVGIRMALGAQIGDILRLVVGEGMRLALIGIALGLAGAFAVTRLLSTLLYGIRATDFFTFAGVSLALAVVAFLASFIPARRAARVNPIVALRYE